MTRDDFKNAGLQRLFQKGAYDYVLLHKSGKAIAFQLDRKGNVTIVDRLTDVSFRSTGLSLIDNGWKCVGPGLAYSKFLE